MDEEMTPTENNGINKTIRKRIYKNQSVQLLYVL